MADPQGVSIAFDSDTLVETPTWTRIDDPAQNYHVASWTISRGRSSELDRMGTGAATIKINDVDGSFDPTNTGGDFFGKLDPMKQMAIALYDPVAETWGTVFRGFVSEWLYDLDASKQVIWTTVECADAFDLFAAVTMMPPDYGESVGVPVGSEGDVFWAFDDNTDAVKTRMDKVLDQLGWPAGMREIFTGNVGLQDTVTARNDALLSVLLDAADADFPGVANIIMSKEGNVMFHGRYARFNPTDPTYHIAQWKAGDEDAWGSDSTIAPLRGLEFRRSKLDIINQVSATPMHATDADVIAATQQDPTSIGIFGTRGEAYENLLTNNGDASSPPHTPPIPTTAIEETTKYAEYYIENYQDPRTRATSLVFKSVEVTHPNAAALWELMTKVEINDIVTLTTTHPGGGGFNETFFVEGINYDVKPLRPDLLDVTLTLDVSPTAYFSGDPFPPQT